MKLIDIIGNVILERTEDIPRDREEDYGIHSDDVPEEFCMEFVDQPDDMVTPICQEFVRQYRERSDEREPEPEREPESDVERETEPVEPIRNIVEPQVTTKTKKPEVLKKVKDVESNIEITKSTSETKKVNPIPTPLYKSENDIKNIKQVQNKSNIKMVERRIEQQIKNQSPETQRKLKRFNIRPENMAYLVPLSDETTFLMIGLDNLGLKLPLMMVLYKNTENLYSSMKQNKPFTEKEAKAIPGFINYKNFWEWSKGMYANWGNWLKDNVVGYFPELATTSVPYRQ
jgi:hypothetical protein